MGPRGAITRMQFRQFRQHSGLINDRGPLSPVWRGFWSTIVAVPFRLG
jgi:hypothetical protein